MFRRCLVAACALLPLLSAVGQDVRLSASVDRQSIRENESFRYILRAEGSLSGRPDLSALAVNFDVLDSYQSTSLQIVGGRTSRVDEWVVELIARRPGTFELPPVELAGVRSNAVSVEVLPAQAASGGASEDVFIEVELDRERGFVQAQSIFTLRLFVGIGTGRQTLTAPLVEGVEAIVEKLGADREYQVELNERIYNVRERRYAIFPQAAGTLTIGPAVYDAMIMPSRGRAYQQRLRSDVLELEVRPAVAPPPEYPDAVWLPAAQVEISESWSGGGPRFEQGVPKTRRLEIVAEGLLETQLPELRLAATPGLRQYSDQPELSRMVTSDGIQAHRTERFAVIAREPGTLELPPIELPWFNVASERWELARLDGRSIDVQPAAATEAGEAPGQAAAGTTAAAAPSGPGWWPRLSAALALGWVLTAAAWAYSARRGQPRRAPRPASRGPTARGVLRQLSAACRVNDPARARELLLEWARHQFSRDAPHSLGALAARLNGPLADEIRSLEAALYGPRPGEWRGETLASLLKQTQSVQREDAAEDKEPLVPLYR